MLNTNRVSVKSDTTSDFRISASCDVEGSTIGLAASLGTVNPQSAALPDVPSAFDFAVGERVLLQGFSKRAIQRAGGQPVSKDMGQEHTLRATRDDAKHGAACFSP